MCSTGVLRTRGRGKKVRREAWDAGDVPRRGRVQLYLQEPEQHVPDGLRRAKRSAEQEARESRVVPVLVLEHLRQL